MEPQRLTWPRNLFYGTDWAGEVLLEHVLLTKGIRADEFDFFQLKKRTLCLLIRASDNACVSSRTNQWTWLASIWRANSLTLLVDAQLLQVVVQVNWTYALLLKKSVYLELDINETKIWRARPCLLPQNCWCRTRRQLFVVDIKKTLLQLLYWRRHTLHAQLERKVIRPRVWWSTCLTRKHVLICPLTC